MAVRDKRSVSRSLFVPGSRKFWGLKTDQARLLYLAMLLGADDEGRLEGADADISAIIPRCKWSRAQLAQYIGNIRRSGLISRYKIKRAQYIQIIDFAEHQSWQGISREPSRIPAPYGSLSASTATSEPRPAQQSASKSAPSPYQGRVGKVSIPSTASTRTASADPHETWKEMRSKYRRKVGKSLKQWKPRGAEFTAILEKHGYDIVMKAFELWLEGSTKTWLRTINYPFALFMKQVQDHIEEAEEIRDTPAVDEGVARPEDDPGHVSEAGKKILEAARAKGGGEK